MRFLIKLTGDDWDQVDGLGSRLVYATRDEQGSDWDIDDEGSAAHGFYAFEDGDSWTCRVVEDLSNPAVEASWIGEPQHDESIRSTEPVDMVNSPPHYSRCKEKLGVEVIEILEFFFPHDPLMWQVGKYSMRAGHKSNELEDLKKARYYLDRKINALQGESEVED